MATTNDKDIGIQLSHDMALQKHTKQLYIAKVATCKCSSVTFILLWKIFTPLKQPQTKTI